MASRSAGSPLVPNSDCSWFADGMVPYLEAELLGEVWEKVGRLPGGGSLREWHVM